MSIVTLGPVPKTTYRLASFGQGSTIWGAVLFSAPLGFVAPFSHRDCAGDLPSYASD